MPDDVKLTRLPTHVFTVSTVDESLRPEHFPAALPEITPSTKVQSSTAAWQGFYRGEDGLCMHICSGLMCIPDCRSIA